MADIYDTAFRTILNDCRQLIIPVINVAFGENYTGKERIEFYPNEHFIDRQNAPDDKRITDSNFIVYGQKAKKYHWECQSTPDAKMLVRLFEYDAQIALDMAEVHTADDVEGDDRVNNELSEKLIVTFPHTAVLYLRNRKNSKIDKYKYVFKTPGGKVEYDVPLLKLQEYTLQEIFDRDLLFLIPFYIFTCESNFEEYENDSQKLETLKDEYRRIVEYIEEKTEQKRISYFDGITLLETTSDVIKAIAQKYANVMKGVDEIMSGEILQTNARRIRDEGISQGIRQGISQGMSIGKHEMLYSLVQDGSLDIEIAANKAEMTIDEFKKSMEAANYKVPEMV